MLRFARAPRLTVPVFAFAFTSTPVLLHAQQPAYLDPALPPERRAADLVTRMTLPEKVSQMQSHAVAYPAARHPGV